jgi:putative membrane protein insertion efficiency factor
MQKIPARILIALLQGYRWLVSPWLGSSCRFHPSCSHYASEALATHGAWRGSWLALARVARCHPWHPGGFDPVPPLKTDRSKTDSSHIADHG